MLDLSWKHEIKLTQNRPELHLSYFQHEKMNPFHLEFKGLDNKFCDHYCIHTHTHVHKHTHTGIRKLKNHKMNHFKLRVTCIGFYFLFFNDHLHLRCSKGLQKSTHAVRNFHYFCYALLPSTPLVFPFMNGIITSLEVGGRILLFNHIFFPLTHPVTYSVDVNIWIYIQSNSSFNCQTSLELVGLIISC